MSWGPTAALCFTSILVMGQPTFPLERLTIKGNEKIATEKIVGYSGLKIGAVVVKEDFDKARARLLATGAFENVGYEFKPSAAKTGYDAIIEVLEVNQIYSYRFEDFPVPDAALRAELKKQEPLLGDKIPATKEVIDRYTAVIQKIAGGTVVGKLGNELPGEMMIVFRPNTPRAQVADVRFVGNDVLPATLLKRTLSGVAIGTAYSETAARLLVESSIRPLYEARGRIRVAFPKITTEPAKMVDGVVVVVTVGEGESYSLSAVNFAGMPAADVKVAEKTARFQAKDIADFDEVKAGVDRVLALYRDKGYLKAAAKQDRQIDDKEHTVAVTITLEPGAQYTMGKLTIVGLDLISEPPIRKVWGIKPGAPFSPEYPDSFLNGLRNDGVFDNLGKTKSETDINENTHVVDVTLYFAGAGPAPKKERP